MCHPFADINCTDWIFPMARFVLWGMYCSDALEKRTPFREEQSVVRDLVEADVYWREGIWTEFEVYPWIQAF